MGSSRRTLAVMAIPRLYRFRYRNARAGGWVTARYRAEAVIIRTRYADYELLDVEVRVVDDSAAYFNPYRPSGTPA